MPVDYLYVALGGAFGSAARYWISGIIARHFGETFPWGTLLVNVSGSFAIGLIASFAIPEGRGLISTHLRNFFMTGVLGGYTTFSSFSLQTLTLAHQGEYAQAAGNVLLSVFTCLAAVWAGYALGRFMNAP